MRDSILLMEESERRAPALKQAAERKGVKFILSGPPFSFGGLDARYGSEAQFFTKPDRSHSIYLG
jgi:hypothetical protein